MGVVLYMWDWIPVRDGASIQGLVGSTGPPTAVLLGHEMEGGRPWALGVSGCAVLQHGVELGLGYGQAFRIKAAWAAGHWRARCCANVLCGECRISRWLPVGFVSSRNSSRRLSGGVPPAMTFTLGRDGGAMSPGVDSDVTPSSRRLFLQSTRSP